MTGHGASGRPRRPRSCSSPTTRATWTRRLILRALPRPMAAAHGGGGRGRLLLRQARCWRMAGVAGLRHRAASTATAAPASGRDPTAHLDRLLGDGWSLVVFAEGTRSRDGERRASCARAPRCWPPSTSCRSCRSTCPGTARGDAASAAAGCQGARPGLRRQPVEIRFGPPIHVAPGEHRSDVMERVRLFLEVQGRDEREPHAEPDPDRLGGLTVGRVFVTGASGFIGGALRDPAARARRRSRRARALRRGGGRRSPRAAPRSPGATCSTRSRSPPAMAGCEARLPRGGRQLPLPGRPGACS